MIDRPKIVIPLIHEIGGLPTRIGQVEMVDDTIVWRFEGTYGESLLEIVRADLIKVAVIGGAQVFDLTTPFIPRTD